MAINFPSSPSVNETHTSGGKEWKWNGSSWVLSTNASSYTLPIATGIALGGVKVGSRLSIDSSTGVLTADVQGGTTLFTGLTDTPSTLTAGKHLKVNAGGTALEYVDNTFTNLTDTPSSLTAGKWLKVNAGGTALEETDAPVGGATVSDAAPSTPSNGDLWFKSDEAVLKVRYEDGSTDAQWVDASPIGSPSFSVGNSSIAITDTGSNGTILFTTEGTDRWEITSSGHILPKQHEQFDIGSADKKVRHLFLSDNSLKFGDKSLGVDGGILQFDGKEVTAAVITGLDNDHVLKYNGVNWVNTVPKFTDSSDTPSSLTAGKWLKVNAGGTAIEETDAPTQGPPPFQSNWRIPL